MKTQRIGAFAATAALAVLLALQGCSTAGSMLVEVDVYKGPLTKGKVVQLGELAAVFDEAEVLLQRFESGAQYVLRGPGVGAGESERAQLQAALVRAQAIRDKLHSYPFGNREMGLEKLALAAAALDARNANGNDTATGQVDSDAQRSLDAATLEASRIATLLKIEAFYWAEEQIGQMPSNASVRSILVGYVNLVSELSNQIASRTDVLSKQVELKLVGPQLALSDHLKDAGPTDFLHLYEWYQATLPDPLLGMGAWPNELTASDRARLARRLFADHYWTRINQVYASGQGEVRMALVKDDIGNWNLKSFDSDPTKLLEAYRNLTYAGIAAGIDLLKKPGGAGALDMASQFARGRLGSTQTATASVARIDSMRARAQSDLEALQADVKVKQKPLADAENAARNDLEPLERKTAEAAKALKVASDNSIAEQKRLDDLRSNAPTATAAIEKANADLDKAYADERTANSNLARALANESTARGAFEAAQKKHRDYVTGVIADARKAIDVHRRVIDALKEMQGGGEENSGILR